MHITLNLLVTPFLTRLFYCSLNFVALMVIYNELSVSDELANLESLLMLNMKTQV